MTPAEIKRELRRKVYLNRREKALLESKNYYDKHCNRISDYKKQWYKARKANHNS
jgi:hypothetical protein